MRFALGKSLRLRIGFLVSALMACGALFVFAYAADVTVTIQSDPPGATLVSEDKPDTFKLRGYAPVTLKDPLPMKWSECLRTSPLRVRWLSGAEASVTGSSGCPQAGKNQQFTFVRPVGAPGAEIDGRFAVQWMQRQAPPPANVIEEPAYHATHCTSSVIGTQVFTTCF